MSFVKTRTKNLYEDTVSGVYYVRIRRKGKKPFNKSLDTKNYKTAQGLTDRYVREYLGHEAKHREHKLFKDAVAKFLPSHETEVKPGTYLRTKSVIRLYLMDYWQSKLLTEITPSAWNEYIKSEKKKRLRNFSNDKKAMDNVFGFAVKEGWIDARPKFNDPSPKSDVGREVTESEIASLLTTSKATDARVYGAICIAYGAGCRIGEVVSIPTKAVHISDRFMTVVGKTGPRKVAIGDFVIQAIEPLLTGQWLFPMASNPTKHMSPNLLDKDWQPIKRAAKVDCRFHDLRHTYITRALGAGHSLMKVSKQVGSSPRTITKVYEHMNVKDLADLGDVIRIGKVSDETVQGESL